MEPVLVAYATTYGSTREVAERIGEILEDRGGRVTVAAAQSVDTLEGYRAVVLGSAIYFFRLHKHTRKFLSRFRSTLRELPVAIFGMGPFDATADEYAGAEKHLTRSLKKYAWLTPVAVTVFGGRFDPKALRFPHKNPGTKQMPPSDIRDWDAIRAWAEALPVVLRLNEN